VTRALDAKLFTKLLLAAQRQARAQVAPLTSPARAPKTPPSGKAINAPTSMPQVAANRDENHREGARSLSKKWGHVKLPSTAPRVTSSASISPVAGPIPPHWWPINAARPGAAPRAAPKALAARGDAGSTLVIEVALEPYRDVSEVRCDQIHNELLHLRCQSFTEETRDAR
jgi:hypothetical protein